MNLTPQQMHEVEQAIPSFRRMVEVMATDPGVVDLLDSYSFEEIVVMQTRALVRLVMRDPTNLVKTCGALATLVADQMVEHKKKGQAGGSPE